MYSQRALFVLVAVGLLTANVVNAAVPIVSNATPSHVRSDEVLTIYGHFSKADDVTVNFTSKATSTSKPTCTKVDHDEYRITCTVRTDPGSIGPWDVVVRQGEEVSVESVYSQVDIDPIPPTFTGFSGPCVDSVLECNNSEITLTGASLPENKENMFFLIGATEKEQGLMQCIISDITATQVKCTLTFETGAPTGEHPVFVQVAIGGDKRSVPTYVGHVLVGTYYGPKISGWSTHDILPPGLLVTSTSYDLNAHTVYLPNGENLVIYGHFEGDAITDYKVIVYNTENTLPKSNEVQPTCEVVKVVSNALTCKMNVPVNVMGMWLTLVQHQKSKAFLPGSTTLPSLALIPPLPEVTTGEVTCNDDDADCAKGGTLRLTGTNFNVIEPKYNTLIFGSGKDSITCDATDVKLTELSCTLSVKNTTAGSYPIYIEINVCPMMKSPTVQIGNLVIGSGPAKWVPNDATTYTNVVFAASPTTVADGGELTIFGVFDSAVTYTVSFTAVDTNADATRSAGEPQCEVNKTTSSFIWCTVSVPEAAGGKWMPRVKDSRSGAFLFVQSQTTSPVTLNPPALKVTSASGDCVRSSAACKSGATMVIEGENFAPAPADNKILISGNDDVRCDVTEASPTSLTCRLTLPEGATGYLPMAMQKRISPDLWSSPVESAGTLILGEGEDKPGWVAFTTETIIHERTNTNNAATIGLGVVFGIVLLVLVGIIVYIFLTFRLVRYSNPNTEMTNFDDQQWGGTVSRDDDVTKQHGNEFPTGAPYKYPVVGSDASRTVS